MHVRKGAGYEKQEREIIKYIGKIIEQATQREKITALRTVIA